MEYVTGISELNGIALDGTYLYWADGTGESVGRAKLAGTEVIRSFVGGFAAPARLAVNSEYFYTINTTTSYIERGPIGGTPVGSSLTIAQAGNRLTPVSFKIHGPCENPSIIRTSDGSRIQLTGELTSGNYLEVLTAERRIELNGTANALAMLNAKLTNWSAFEAPPNPRTVTYQLAATTATAAYMEAMYRSAYA